MQSRKESFKMRVNFSSARGEQMKPKLTAVEESSRRQEGMGQSSGSRGRDAGHALETPSASF